MTTQMNCKRMALSGFLAGFLIFVITGVVNGAILHTQLETWMLSMSGIFRPLPQSSAMGLWALMCLIYGMIGVWIYAGIRAHYGAGPKTALRAGLMVWLVSKVGPALDFTALGIMPDHIIVGQTIGGFFALMIGIVAGAWLYKE